MIIFLDFDGVLHPEPCTQERQEFCNMPYLESILRAYPNIEIVISSSWRLLENIEILRSYFSEDLRHRVIDITPDLPSSDFSRSKECNAWLNHQHRSDEAWIAIDDWPHHFDSHMGRQLFLTNYETGLDAESAVRLRLLIDEFLK